MILVKQEENTMKKGVLLLSLFCIVMALFSSCGGEEPAAQTGSEEPQVKKIGVVYTTSGRGDMAFNDATYEGVMRAAEDFGVEVDHTEPKSLSEIEMVIEEMSASGEYELIIGITFEALDAVARIAPNYPEQKYALVDCETGMDNVVSYIAKENEGAFMGGCLAALLQKYRPNDMITDSKTIGIIGAMDAAVVNRHITGYTCGAKYIDPEMEVLYDYVGSFNDTTTGLTLAQAMYNSGANIVYNAAAASGLGVFKAAADNGFMAIGLDSNQNYIDPDHIVASVLKRVDEFVYSAISDVLNDNFHGGEVYYLGLAEDGVGYTFDDSNIVVSQEVKDILEDVRRKVVSGEIVVPETIDQIDAFVSEYSYY